jgi:O-antigen ligase
VNTIDSLREWQLRFRRLALRRDWLFVPIVVIVSWLAGSAVASGGLRGMLALSLGGAVVSGLLLVALFRSRFQWDFASVELPAFLILMSELVFRVRDAQSLASNPLDTAGLYRVGCLGLALLLGLLALTSPVDRTHERLSTRPFRLYCLYVFVVFVGAPLSLNLPLTAYRGVELLAGVLVVAGAFRRAGIDAVNRILSVIYWFTAASAILIWLEALVMPGTAFARVDTPFPIQLTGVLPAVSANGTGTIGAVLALWSLARLLEPKDRGAIRPRTLRLLAALGFVTLVFAQYRTGTIAAVVGLLVLLGFRARPVVFWVVLAAAFVAIAWGSGILHVAAPIFQRGENPEVLSRLSGRLNYWAAALPVWRESPWFGRGLLTASRYEVLAESFSVYVSTIHGTWVEALVGTGVIGVALLAGSFLISSVRALKEATRSNGRIVPLVLLSIIAVRSITGSTFEVAGSASLVFITIALILRDKPTHRERDLVSTAGLGASV